MDTIPRILLNKLLKKMYNIVPDVYFLNYNLITLWFLKARSLRLGLGLEFLHAGLVVEVTLTKVDLPTTVEVSEIGT